MRYIWRLLTVVAFGCDSKVDEPMTIHETLAAHVDSQLGDSIVLVTRALATTSVLVATRDNPTKTTGTLPLKVASDNENRLWAYMYTDVKEFSAAFPEGGHYVEMAFPDAFEIVNANEQFGGIFINRSPKLMYLIPKDVFADVERVLSE